VAASTGDVEKVREFLDSGIPVDWPTFEGSYFHASKHQKTALWFAVEHNHLQVVKLLLECDAGLCFSNDIRSPKCKRVYCAIIAKERGYLEIEAIFDEAAKKRAELRYPAETWEEEE